MTTFLLIMAVLLILVGIIGAIVPALPGPPLSWAGLLLAYLAADNTVSTTVLLVMLGVTVLVTVLDYFAPALMTKLGGGSKAASTGATVGTLLGLFVAPWGLLFGPMIGAFLGEWISVSRQPVIVTGANVPAESKLVHSLRVALLSFAGFLLTTGLKLVSCLWMGYYVVKAIIALF